MLYQQVCHQQKLASDILIEHAIFHFSGPISDMVCIFRKKKITLPHLGDLGEDVSFKGDRERSFHLFTDQNWRKRESHQCSQLIVSEGGVSAML